MFHKRNDRLQQLNEELLAEDEEYIEEYEDAYDGEELDEADIAGLLGEEEDETDEHLYSRNYANRYRKGSALQFDESEYDEEDDLADEEFLYRDDFRRAKKQQRKARRAEKKAKRKERKGKLGLAILALIELIAIGGIIAWWISWIL